MTQEKLERLQVAEEEVMELISQESQPEQKEALQTTLEIIRERRRAIEHALSLRSPALTQVLEQTDFLRADIQALLDLLKEESRKDGGKERLAPCLGILRQFVSRHRSFAMTKAEYDEAARDLGMRTGDQFRIIDVPKQGKIYIGLRLNKYAIRVLDTKGADIYASFET